MTRLSFALLLSGAIVSAALAAAPTKEIRWTKRHLLTGPYENAAVADLKSALSGDDVEAIQAKTNALAQASMKLGEAMYQQGQAGEANASDAAGPSEGGAGKEDVVDADFEEVDEKKKSA